MLQELARISKDMDENQHRAIMGGGCIALVIAAIVLIVTLLCAFIDML